MTFFHSEPPVGMALTRAPGLLVSEDNHISVLRNYSPSPTRVTVPHT